MTPAAVEIAVLLFVPLLVAAVARALHPPRERHLAPVRVTPPPSGRRPTGR